MTSANLYFIKSTDTGRYLHGKFNTWHDKVILSTYATSEKNAFDIAKHFGYTNFEIVKINEYDYTALLASETTRLIIQMDSILLQLEDLRYQIPTISQINKVSHKIVKNACEQLKVINPYFNNFIKQNEDTTYDVKGIYDDFIHELAKVEIYECSNLTAILKEYAKRPEEVMKILNL